LLLGAMLLKLVYRIFVFAESYLANSNRPI
jgi:hypothetical protein